MERRSKVAVLGATIAATATAVATYDLVQRRHAILRNFPVVGHLRYLLESIGPELRQYIVTDNNEERPFSRDQRSWIYASSKRELNTTGFGTDKDLEHPSGHLILKPAVLPAPEQPSRHVDAAGSLPAAKVLGGHRARRHAFRPGSIVHVSALSFGALSAPAIEALNRGAALAGCLHNTGEGSISPHHLHGGDLVWQIGTGYFGCRTPDGHLDLERLVDTAAEHPVRAIELKLSQGAKAGLGGLLPGVKVTPEIAAIRGIPVGEDCVSPPYHTAFRTVDELLDLVETIAERTGLPVGIKSAVGQLDFWEELSDHMADGGRGVDFITIDGGEGGTGAAPGVFADHVALPFMVGFSRVYRLFAERDVDHDVVWIGAGRLGLPENALLAMALGTDLVCVAREAMLAIGCVQTLRCHTGGCPTGVATQSRWLAGGLDPELKAERVAAYLATLTHDLHRLGQAAGVAHPGLVTLDHLELLDHPFAGKPARETFSYQPGWGSVSEDQRAVLVETVLERAGARPSGGPGTGEAED